LDEQVAQLLRRWLFCQPGELSSRDSDLATYPPEVRSRFHAERAALEAYADRLLPRNRRPGEWLTPEEWLADYPDLSKGGRALARQIDRVLRDNGRAKRLGSTIGPYSVLYRLGVGGMAEVYAVEKVVQGQSCTRALKIVHLADNYGDLGDAEKGRIVKDLHARLCREAEILERVQHPHVVRYFDKDDDPANGELYIVTELIEGFSLQRLLEEGGAFAPEEALAVATEVCEGLTAAHAAGVTHRDVSPKNVLVTVEGCSKVIDFGLARGEPARGHSVSAPDGLAWRTERFASPEQRDGGPLTPATDQYSLGKLFYVLLRYQPVWEQHPEWPIPGPEDPAWQALPPGYAAVIRRATADDAARRYPDTAGMLSALRGLAAGAVPPKPLVCARVAEMSMENAPLVSRRLCFRLATQCTPPVVVVEPAVKRPRRVTYAAGAAGAGLLALVAWASAVGWHAQPPTPSTHAPSPPGESAEYEGELNFIIAERAGARLQPQLLLGAPGAQRVLAGDRVYLTFVQKKGPAARFYVLHIDSEGKATPLSPADWNWEEAPRDPAPARLVRFPPRGDGPVSDSPPGLEAVICLVRHEALTAKDNADLRRLFAAPALKWLQPKSIPDSVYWLENGFTDSNRGAPRSDGAGVATDPLSQLQNVLLEINDRKLSQYSQAVCYPFGDPKRKNATRPRVP
jgi:hypothetical protein